MPTTILDGEAYPEALQRRYAEEAKVEERMTTKLEQAARQALGALVRAEAMYGQPNADIQTALREALAEQAEQEPVAWCWMLGECAHIVWGSRRPDDAIHTTPLYTSPQPVKEVELTDDELLKIWQVQMPASDRVYNFARAVIAAHKAKQVGGVATQQEKQK